METGDVWKALDMVLDPDLGLSIVKLGLVYRVEIDPSEIQVDYTLTSPGCPLAAYIESDIRSVLSLRYPDRTLVIRLVWSPLWGPERMDEELRLDLGYPL